MDPAESVKVLKELQPSSIIYFGFVVLLAISEWQHPSDVIGILEIIIILIVCFFIVTVSNTLYFRWYKEQYRPVQETFSRGRLAKQKFSIELFLAGTAIAVAYIFFGIDQIYSQEVKVLTGYAAFVFGVLLFLMFLGLVIKEIILPALTKKK